MEQFSYPIDVRLSLTEVGGFEFVQFERLKRIEVLEINKKDIKPDWKFITNGLVLIPSKTFRKLKMTTLGLEHRHISELVSSVAIIKQQVHVEVRCEKLSLKMDILNSQLGYVQLKDYRTTFQKTKTHLIVRFRHCNS